VRRTRFIAVLGAALVLCGALAAGDWVGARGLPARERLTRTGELLQQFELQLQARNITGARATLASLTSEAGIAHRLTNGVDWALISTLPGAGPNAHAVRTIAAVLDDLAQNALPAMLDLADGVRVSAFAPTAAGIDLTPLQRTAPRLTALDRTVADDLQTVTAIDPEGLVQPLGRAVTQLQAGLAHLRGLTRTAARAAVLLPAMLGAREPRTYLVLFQNPAETRATGGMPGAFIVVRADRGKLAIVDHGAASEALRSFEKPVLPLDRDMLALYTDRPAIFPADVNATPYYPAAAMLAREMYRRRSGVTVDGVIATDPVALSYVLGALGPVPMPTGPTLTAQNVVRTLLVDAYARTSTPAEKNAYFAIAARTVFAALTKGVADPTAATRALARAAGERRLLIWSAHPDEEAAISGTVLEGALPTQDGPRLTVGVFLNDGSGAKLDYYLTHSARLRLGACRADGRRELSLHLTLGSTAPRGGLPPYVLGLGLAGDPYTSRTVLMVFSPTGGAVTGMRVDGAAVPSASGLERHRVVGVLTVDLRPGQTKAIDVDLLSAPFRSRDAQSNATTDLWVTPGVNPWPNDVGSPLTCENAD
jgi:hypothetical protein